MKIKKIFNNNSVLVDTKSGKEAVVFGKGIGFNKSENKKIDSDKIQKIFYVAGKNDKDSFLYLFRNIPVEITSIVFDIVKHAKQKYNFKVYDSIYLTLSEHIAGSYKSIVNKNYQENEIPDFKQKYPLEYKISADAVSLINEKLKVKFPQSEVRSIALHFINSKVPNNIKHLTGEEEIFDTSKIINMVINILDDNNVYQTADNENNFRRFLVHLQYLANRMRNPPKGKDSIDKKIQADMIKAYPRSYAITQKIFKALKREFNFEPSDAEETYFIIHIHQIIINSK
ncbi:PRD domain-containing protein [Lactobacillus sp. ESL0731]|uniref:PRD domain-containing protein n=1 Tax=unclassified Lactobacillus TaxID=2620435 RepID=UPI0023F8AD1F|nr:MULTISPECIES: PRD domain-containing protein [unclassified Lactobacillus]WEV51449.1 PRD domain-containing protein [Lactobacillus sp. ESL0700]WEV62578.1 PRD domain-containing protein [Lactobacillus sp. ESL0731]